MHPPRPTWPDLLTSVDIHQHNNPTITEHTNKAITKRHDNLPSGTSYSTQQRDKATRQAPHTSTRPRSARRKDGHGQQRPKRLHHLDDNKHCKRATARQTTSPPRRQQTLQTTKLDSTRPQRTETPNTQRFTQPTTRCPQLPRKPRTNTTHARTRTRTTAHHTTPHHPAPQASLVKDLRTFSRKPGLF
jgi:hypothetical protein